MTAAGQVRSHCLLRGIPLPRLGTFEFYLLLESIRREKAEKAAFAKLLVDLEVASGRVANSRAQLILIEYEEELRQFKYNYDYVPFERRLESTRVDARMEDMRVLDKVAAMTVSDEDVGRPR